MSLRLDEVAVADILSETTKVIRAKPEHNETRDFSLKGSRGTATHLSVTTQIGDGKISFTLHNGGLFNLGRIEMPVGNFPGTAREFLQDITVPDPDALTPPLMIHSASFKTGRCRPSYDGGMT